MIFLLFVFILAFVFLLLFYFINYFLSLKDGYSNKLSSFECGFMRIGKIQTTFSIHFFIVMLMFVIFDLEIVMFLGLIISDVYSFFSFVFIIFFILGGFYMEWVYGKLV